MTIYDISEYQGNINFAELKTDGIIARVQSGSSHPDKMYDTYVKEMIAHKIPFGSYSYFKAVSDSDAVQEAKDTLARMSKESKFFVLDIEEVTAPNLISAGQAYVDYLAQNGVKKIGLYSGEDFYKTHKLNEIKGISFLWLAKYGSDNGEPQVKPSIPCDLWQYTSKGKLSAIPDNTVDIDMIVGNKSISYFFGNGELGTVTVQVDLLNVRTGPSLNASIVKQVRKGQTFNYYAVQNGWYEIATGQWVFGDNGRYLK